MLSHKNVTQSGGNYVMPFRFEVLVDQSNQMFNQSPSSLPLTSP
jgi:hypothetical protein